MEKTRLAAMIFAMSLLSAACSANKPAATSQSSGSTGQTEDVKVFYAMGAMLGSNLKMMQLTPAELEQVKKGLSDSALGVKLEVDLETYQPKVQQLAQARGQAAAETEKTKAKGFADAAAQESGAVRTPSGLVFRTLSPGTGSSPAADSIVKVHYEGSLIDGTVFDSSVKRGTPAEFRLNRVIACWGEALQRMKVGEKAKIVCPSNIAYGDGGRPPVIPGGATLVFQVELLEHKAPPKDASQPSSPKPVLPPKK